MVICDKGSFYLAFCFVKLIIYDICISLWPCDSFLNLKCHKWPQYLTDVTYDLFYKTKCKVKTSLVMKDQYDTNDQCDNKKFYKRF